MNIKNNASFEKQAMKQRIADFKQFCKSNRISLVEVISSCGYRYDSTIHVLSRPSISAAKLEILEEKAIQIANLQLSETTKHVEQYKFIVNSNKPLGLN